MDYKTWKTNFENEFKAHRDENTVLIYDYQDGYDYYLNSPDWIMYGDFCNFIRRGTENRGAEITAKYEALLVENLEIFTGFIKDEFKRIHPLRNIDERLYKIFEYNNMTITPDDFTPEQTQAFNQAVTEYKEENKENIELIKRHDDEMAKVESDPIVKRYNKIVENMEE